MEKTGHKKPPLHYLMSGNVLFLYTTPPIIKLLRYIYRRNYYYYTRPHQLQRNHHWCCCSCLQPGLKASPKILNNKHNQVVMKFLYAPYLPPLHCTTLIIIVIVAAGPTFSRHHQQSSLHKYAPGGGVPGSSKGEGTD